MMPMVTVLKDGLCPDDHVHVDTARDRITMAEWREFWAPNHQVRPVQFTQVKTTNRSPAPTCRPPSPCRAAWMRNRPLMPSSWTWESCPTVGSRRQHGRLRKKCQRWVTDQNRLNGPNGLGQTCQSVPSCQTLLACQTELPNALDPRSPVAKFLLRSGNQRPKPGRD